MRNLDCLVMIIQETPEYDMPAIKKAHLPQSGHIYSIDFMMNIVIKKLRLFATTQQ